jgi:hypothetical protein
MRRENGILEMRFHTDNGPLRWGLVPHGELPDAFADVARDRDNRVVILTGTGDEFSGVRATPGTRSLAQGLTANAYDRVHSEGRALLMNLLNIEVPVIAAINGPAWRHAEIPLRSDIVVASETAAFQDAAHFLKCRHELLRLGQPKPKVSDAGVLIALDAGNLGLRHLTRPQLRHQFHPPHRLRHQATPLPVSRTYPNDINTPHDFECSRRSASQRGGYREEHTPARIGGVERLISCRRANQASQAVIIE